MASKLQDKIHKALQEIVHEDPDKEFNMAGGLVAKWALGIEVILPDGTTVLYHNCSSNTPAWQILGMLEYLAEVERSKVHRDYYREDED